MAFQLELSQKGVLQYLRDRDTLTREGRIIILTHLITDLRERGDYYMNDESLRLSPGSKYFFYDLVFLDPADGLGHRYWFAVRDDKAMYGYLYVDYAEETQPGSTY